MAEATRLETERKERKDERQRVEVCLDEWDARRLAEIERALSDVLQGSENPRRDALRFCVLATYTLMREGPISVRVEPATVSRTEPSPMGSVPWHLSPKPKLGIERG